MQAAELTAEFGIAGVLDFVETEHGLVKAAISLDGVAGELYLQGAHLTAWRPPGERPVLSPAPTALSPRAGRSAAASRSSSRGLAPTGRHRRRRSTALRVLHNGISTGSK